MNTVLLSILLLNLFLPVFAGLPNEEKAEPYGKDKVTIRLRNVVLTPNEERPLDLFTSDDEYLKLK